MDITQESIQSHLPYYLTQEAKDNLTIALNNFPDNFNYYTFRYPNDYLQGDGWSPLEVASIENNEKKAIKGIFISNSCDIDPRNRRDIPAKISFVPIIKLSTYLSFFKKAGLDETKIKAKVDSIRIQRITNIFYLPQGGRLDADYVALLDEVYTTQFSQFEIRDDKQKLFTLSQAGFYMFLLKLSVHFCRFHEQIHR